MTNDGTLKFDKEKNADKAEKLLKEIKLKLNKSRLFYIERLSSNQLFYQIEIYDLINENEKILFNKKEINFFEHIELIAERTGAHIPTGDIFYKNIEIPNRITNELLILINIANQNSKEGFFVFDFKFCKINFNLISPYYIKTEDSSLDDFLKIKLDFTKSLFHNFVSGVHNLFYREKIESASLELLFLKNKGCA